MGNIQIDRELCTQCGLCVQDCVRGLFSQKADGQIVVTDEGWCSLCGHCVAVCPSEAISHAALGEAGFERITEEMQVDPSRLRAFLRTRRSVRAYRDEPVPRSVIEDLIEVARFAPTAANRQNVAFTVVDGRATLRRLSDLTADFYENLADRLSEPSFVEGLVASMGADVVKLAIDNIPYYRRFVGRYRRGEDVFLWNAPALIVASAPTLDNFGRDNCLLAACHLMLAANARKMGTCLLGIFLRALQQDAAIAEVIDLPADHTAHVACVVGYPRYGYRRLVPRSGTPIRWIGD